jgi:hypothetical protein
MSGKVQPYWKSAQKGQYEKTTKLPVKNDGKSEVAAYLKTHLN